MAISKYYLLICSLIFLIIAGSIHSLSVKPIHKITKQEAALNFKDEMVLTFHVGLRRLISSTLWIQSMIESDLEHYNKSDLNNWLYLRFNTILKLDPLFKEAYTYGGLYLSVVKDDKTGAKDIFDRGLKQYPNDFYLSYYALFHYYFELKKPEKAYAIFLNIKDDPKVPFFIKSLMAQTAKEQDDAKFAQELLNYARKLAPTKDIKQKIDKRLKDLEGPL